ncbi:OsmC family protein [Ascidiimonas sp. W6]|uniref:OsmC family protein n=1 Tax=Ascidiimonas meishanensis TaxID=3128903 RepID=UPI0030ECE0F9
MKTHPYKIKVEWIGNQGEGTLNYKSYSRNHTIYGVGKYQEILASSDPSFLGDKSKYNPEDLFLSSIATCHMLWYLHLCSANKIIVTAYVDNATAVMTEKENGSGQFTEVMLHPHVKITDANMIAKANQLHTEANKMCFIANSVNFKIGHHPTTIVA